MEDKLNKEIETLKAQVADLLKWKKEKEKQQLTLPLDHASVRVLDNAFRVSSFSEFSVQNLRMHTDNEADPYREGEIVYDRAGGTEVLKIYINGAVRTFTVT